MTEIKKNRRCSGNMSRGLRKREEMGRETSRTRLDRTKKEKKARQGRLEKKRGKTILKRWATSPLRNNGL